MPTHICCRDCRFEAVVSEMDAERTIETHEEDEGHTVDSESFEGSKRLTSDEAEEVDQGKLEAARSAGAHDEFIAFVAEYPDSRVGETLETAISLDALDNFPGHAGSFGGSLWKHGVKKASNPDTENRRRIEELFDKERWPTWMQKEASEDEVTTDGGLDTLRLTEDGIEIPEDVDFSEGIVFRARGATVDHKPGHSDREFYPMFRERHLTAEDRSVVNEDLDEFEISIKPYGEEARIYEVTAPATDGGYPLDTVAESFAEELAQVIDRHPELRHVAPHYMASQLICGADGLVDTHGLEIEVKQVETDPEVWSIEFYPPDRSSSENPIGEFLGAPRREDGRIDVDQLPDAEYTDDELVTDGGEVEQSDPIPLYQREEAVPDDVTDLVLLLAAEDGATYETIREQLEQIEADAMHIEIGNIGGPVRPDLGPYAQPNTREPFYSLRLLYTVDYIEQFEPAHYEEGKELALSENAREAVEVLRRGMLDEQRAALEEVGVETAPRATDGAGQQTEDYRTRVEELLNDVHSDRVFSVEEDVVWVSGMNSGCPRVARKMARTLVKHDIPAGLVYDDDAVQHGGVQFNYGDSA